MKKNIVLRAVYVFLALTFTTTSLALTRAKYVSSNTASGTTFTVYHLLPGIVRQVPATTVANKDQADSAVKATYYDCPAGKWAFYVKGGYGLGNGNALPNAAGEARRKPAILSGIYTKTTAGSFTIGRALRGTRTNGSGGNGGNGVYILDGITSPRAGVVESHNANTKPRADKHASLAGIVAVAGGGGGRGSTSSNGGNGGYAGGYYGKNGPFQVQSTAADSGKSGIEDGWRGTDAGTQTTWASGYMGGGGGGSEWQWWYGGESSSGTNGSWFAGGAGESGSSYDKGGGGGGIFGGGGGSWQTLGVGRSGGGGSSYIDPNNCVAVPNMSFSYASDTVSKTMTKYAAPTTYYEYALNYFFDVVAANTSAVSHEEIVILVWLGP